MGDPLKCWLFLWGSSSSIIIIIITTTGCFVIVLLLAIVALLLRGVVGILTPKSRNGLVIVHSITVGNA